MSTISEDELEAQNLNSNVKKPDRKPSGDDPISDYLLRTYYWIKSDYESTDGSIIIINLGCHVTVAAASSSSSNCARGSRNEDSD